MRKRIAAVVAGLAISGGVPIVAPPAVATPTAHGSCTSATISGQPKCLARGQYCSRSRKSQYKKYGYSCSKRDKNGRYHLT